MCRISKIDPLMVKGLFFFVVIYFGTPLVGAYLPSDADYTRSSRTSPVKSISDEWDRLGFGSHAKDEVLNDLMRYQKKTGYSLSQILRDPKWCKRLGYQSQTFRATWYIANPFDLLPAPIQRDISKREKPFKSRAQVWEWCRVMKYGSAERKSLKAAPTSAARTLST